MIGKSLAHYVIESRLGAGGMGEVYQARDTRLGRNVAVKLLPEIFARDNERIARFQREAKVLAAMNHPNIAALYGLEEVESTRFLVMELVDGETLAERISRAAIPVEEALKVAVQIAEALEAAHEKGIVHRDLKPANVKITGDGKVKVLDFGLAKAMETSPAVTSLSNSPTLSIAATNGGVILGTAAYMSPEQANGFNTDNRSDIFSFGAVLYEMLTRRQAFQGRTVSEVMASVIAREPDMNLLPARLNPRIPHLLCRCLEKEPNRRWHAVADLRLEIESALADPIGLLVATQTFAQRKPVWKRAIPVVVTAILFSIAGAIAALNYRPSTTPIVTRFEFNLPDGQQFTNAGRQLIAISPDGSQLVYVANNRLYLKPMGQLQATVIQGTEMPAGGVAHPVFSPDGQSIVFWTGFDQTLKRITVTGGAPVTIVPAGNPFGVSWSPNNEIVFGQGRGIMRVSANGGAPEAIVTVKGNESAHGPQILPEGDAVLYTVATTVNTAQNRWDRAQIVVQTISTGERKTLIEGGSDARYVPTGHIVYALAGTLLAIPFDVKRQEVTGAATPLVEGVRAANTYATGTSQFSFSNTGSLAYIPTDTTDVQNSLALVDRNGSAKTVTVAPGPAAAVRISPNGKQLALATNDGKEAIIWVYDLAGASSFIRLTFGGGTVQPIWSGDGERVLFQSNREGANGIFWQRADGTGVAERLTQAEAGVNGHLPNSWRPKDDRFSYVVQGGGGGRFATVWTYSIKDKKATPFANVPGATQVESAFSPDGNWLAYQSDETGTAEVYVQPFPPTGAKFQITRGSPDRNHQPLWSPDGKELFYVSQGRLFSVPIRTLPNFTFGNPAPLPITGIIQAAGAGPRQYDITPDGKQFIVIRPPRAAPTETRSNDQIQVVLNWFTELQQRVPVK